MQAKVSTGGAQGYNEDLYGNPPPPAYTSPQHTISAPQPAYGFQAAYGQAPHYVQAPGYVPPVAYGQPAQNMGVVTVVNTAQAPPIVLNQPIPVNVPNYLGWSIFNLLCCFWPLGLAALIYSTKVNSAGSYDAAKRNSIIARNLNISATVIAPVLVIIIVASVVGGAATAARSAYSYYYSPSYTYSGYYSYAYYNSYNYNYYYNYYYYSYYG